MLWLQELVLGRMMSENVPLRKIKRTLKVTYV